MSNAQRPQSRLRRHGAALLSYPSFEKATVVDLKSEKTIAIFVHGFTADSSYMSDLMHQFDAADFKCLSFEYPSDKGIDVAARQLRSLLEAMDVEQRLTRKKVVLVGHSMGGLVCRAFVALEAGEDMVRNVITLGTPHQGTLKDAKVLQFLLDWGESVSVAQPWAFGPDCRSGKQLMLADTDNGSLPLLKKLSEIHTPTNVQFDTFSGGKNHIEFGRNPIKNAFANSYLSKHLTQPNDGLVEEESAKIVSPNINLNQKLRHHVDYVEYPYINHSYLVNNQIIALLALNCAQIGDLSK